MSNIFSSFLDTVSSADGYMYDYAHASRLYRDDNLYSFAPKAGWMYYVRIGINPATRNLLDKTWQSRYKSFVGLLAKAADQPKFTISTETLNQYNRKTVVQTKLQYSPLTITFHDDMASATTDLWKNYYQYYFADGNYGNKAVGRNSVTIGEFSDTKYLDGSIPYGYANGTKVPFFNDITIYALNKKRYTSVTLINPVIKEWQHSGLDQSSNKMLENRMTVEYEAVVYNKGRSAKLSGFNEDHYDRRPSPLAVGGNGAGSLLGTISGAADIFGEDGSLENATTPLDYLGVAIQGANLLKNASKITAASLKQEGYSVLTGQLNSIGRSGNLVPQGSIIDQASTSLGSIKIFSGSGNTTTNPINKATPYGS